MPSMKVVFYIRRMDRPNVDHHHRPNDWKQIILDTDGVHVQGMFGPKIGEMIEAEVIKLLAAGKTATDTSTASPLDVGDRP